MGGCFSAICCLFRSDLKALVAFSSVFHMSFLAASVRVFAEERVVSCALVSCAHGFVSIALFFLVGNFYFFFGRRSLVFGRVVVGSFVFLGVLVACFVLNTSVPIGLSFFSEFFVFKQILGFVFPSVFVGVLGVFIGGLFIAFWV